jgi:tRNA pseudouridine55 synthase
MAFILYNKNYTETLACMLGRFRREYPEYETSKITYAGRLDPMAEGLMILLSGDDVHRKQDFLDMNKVYYVDFIFGPHTDTLDILGCVDTHHSKKMTVIDQELLLSTIKKISYITELEYPLYSSKTVNGKPLWTYARENKIHTVVVPKKKVSIYDVAYQGYKDVPSIDFLDNIKHDIQSVQGNFRQSEIIQSWDDYYQIHLGDITRIYSLKLTVSSGTYVRSIVEYLGKKIGIPAASLRIKRIQIGDNLLS